jgi:hypothetical protein
MENGKHECAEILLKMNLNNISFSVISKIITDDNADYFKWIYTDRPELRPLLNYKLPTPLPHNIKKFIDKKV